MAWCAASNSERLLDRLRAGSGTGPETGTLDEGEGPTGNRGTDRKDVCANLGKGLCAVPRAEPRPRPDRRHLPPDDQFASKLPFRLRKPRSSDVSPAIVQPCPRPHSRTSDSGSAISLTCPSLPHTRGTVSARRGASESLGRQESVDRPSHGRTRQAHSFVRR